MNTKRPWLIGPPIVVGGLVLAWLITKSPGHTRGTPSERTRTLRTINVPVVDVIPRAVGYGVAQPARVWRAVAEVKGRLIEVHPDLAAGAFLHPDTQAARIDPEEYALAVTRTKAEIAEMDARLKELEAQEANDKASLEIEEASLSLAQRDLDRIRGLREQDAAAPTEVRDEERLVLSQRLKVQAMKNSLNLVPSQREALNASLNLLRAKLAQAELDLARTELVVPYACRVREAALEVGEYVAGGEVLFEADGIDATEIEVQVPLGPARTMIRAPADRPLGIVPDQKLILQLMDTRAIVRSSAGRYKVEWEARLERIRERLDPDTRTIGVVVVVDRPYETAIPGERPPLFRGVFCEVELRGKPIAGRIVVPRAAVHEDHVYVLDKQNRLARRRIVTEFEQTNFVCVASGLTGGETVVVSDPTPAVDGMRVDPVNDPERLDALIAEATAKSMIR